MSGTSVERLPSTGGDHGSDSLGVDPHGAVEPAHHAAIVSYNPDAPSEEWGWHGHWGEFAPRGKAILLWLGVFGLVCLALFGNQESKVEDYWLVVIAGLMAVWLVMRSRKHKRDRARRP